MRKIDVLVTGADQRQGLAVIRALGCKGLRIFAAGLESNSIGFFSRYTHGFCKYPSPSTDKRDFIYTILKVVKKHHIPFVFPVVESTVIALDEFRSEFKDLTQLALPPRESLHLALDKKKTLALARELSIPAPESYFASSLNEALAFAERVGYPVVVKPRAMLSFKKVRGNFKFKVIYVRDSEELKKLLQPCVHEGIYPILQEYCPGIKVNQGLLYVGSQCLGLYQYKGIREYPLTGGVTSLHMSVPIDPELQGWTLSLLEAMKWDGVAMVEYKVNESSGRKVLMEVNGRFWAPQSAASKLGLNFPYALFQYMKDGVKEQMAGDYPLGKRNRYLRGDLSALVDHWQGRSPDYMINLPGKGRILWDFLKDFQAGVQGDVLDLKDPSPGLHELLLLLKQYGRQVPAYYIKKILKSRRNPNI